MTDPIADMLTRIRNAQAVCKETVVIPFSKFKFSLAGVLLKAGYLTSVDVNSGDSRTGIVIKLKYNNKKPAIERIKRVSRPGQRIYIKSNEIYPVRSGYGLTIISTPKGLMTNTEAKKNSFGGEVICELW